ncbi:MAG TPA: hypothetical protein VK213_08135 [Bacteroidales bacterium]|nr:hypothetical protein [Bacteroidales bacterium]
MGFLIPLCGIRNDGNVFKVRNEAACFAACRFIKITSTTKHAASFHHSPSVIVIPMETFEPVRMSTEESPALSVKGSGSDHFPRLNP